MEIAKEVIKNVAIFLGIVALVLIVFAVIVLMFLWAWNDTMVNVFGLPELDVKNALHIFLLLIIGGLWFTPRK